MHKPGGCGIVIICFIVFAGVIFSLETIWGKILLICSIAVLVAGWHRPLAIFKGNAQYQHIISIWLAGMLLMTGGLIGYAHIEDTKQSERAAHPKQEEKMDYEGYINKNTFFCDDYETLIRLSDALQHKDNDLIGQLTLEGKIHLIDKDTKVSIIDTGLIDKNAVSIVIEEGRYDLKSGYTFKDWTRKR